MLKIINRFQIFKLTLGSNYNLGENTASRSEQKKVLRLSFINSNEIFFNIFSPSFPICSSLINRCFRHANKSPSYLIVPNRTHSYLIVIFSRHKLPCAGRLRQRTYCYKIETNSDRPILEIYEPITLTN